MASKYPGMFIIYEVGSRADLAKSYGVSERTIYRWLNRAAKESGESLNVSRSSYPGLSAIAKFKGTRKQLAAQYGVSERTAYRWLNKARAEMASKPTKGAYPGASILTETGSNNDLAAKYGVSSRTISRWKERAQEESNLKPRRKPKITINAPEQEPQSAPDRAPEPEEPEEPYIESKVDDIYEEDEIPEDLHEIPGLEDLKDDTLNNLKGIDEILMSSDDLLTEGSIFRDLTFTERMQYLDAYIQYQYDLDEHQFYNEETGKMDFSPEFISTLNIWGEEFEDWAQKQFDYSLFEV